MTKSMEESRDSKLGIFDTLFEAMPVEVLNAELHEWFANDIFTLCISVYIIICTKTAAT